MMRIQPTVVMLVAIMALGGACVSIDKTAARKQARGVVWYNPASKEVLRFRGGYVIRTSWDSAATGLVRSEQYFPYAINPDTKELSFNATTFTYPGKETAGWALQQVATTEPQWSAFRPQPQKVKPNHIGTGLSKTTEVAGLVSVRGEARPAAATVTYEALTALGHARHRQVTQSDSAGGSYRLLVPAGHTYRARVEAPGYLGEFRIIEVPAHASTESQARLTADTLQLIALRKDASGQLNTVTFEFDEAALKAEAFPELMNLVRVLQQHPTMRIEIAGHTDDQGTRAYNQTLSEKRAAAVEHFLHTKGIAPARLTTIGYGETKPLPTAPNAPVNHTLNRRIEIRITDL